MLSMSKNKALVAALSAAFAVGLAGASNAYEMKVNGVAAAIAAPYVTGSGSAGEVITAIVVTNTLDSRTVLQLHVIDGDADGNWEERSFDCWMTGRETTLITVTATATGAKLQMECSDPGASVHDPATLSHVVERSLPGSRGIVFVALKDENHVSDDWSKLENRLIADWTVIDFGAGAAYSAEALHFQAGEAPCPTDTVCEQIVDLAHDQAFEFNGVELSGFPSVVASNFIAPDCTDIADPATCAVDAELLLITLDGQGGTPPVQRSTLDFYNDDERFFDNVDHTWACMTIARLGDLDADFNADQLCPGDSAPLGCVGHFVLSPRLVSVGFSNHDLPYLGGFGGFGGPVQDFTRLSLFHGWLIQRYSGEVLNHGPMSGPDATARLLNQGNNVNRGFLGDHPALDLR